MAQTFEIGGQRGARIDAAEADVRAAQATSQSAVLDLQANVLGAAAEVISARGALAVAREQREAAERLREVSAARALKGAAAPLETELADAARIQALRDERVAAQVLAEAEAELASAVGEDVRLVDGAALPASVDVTRTLSALEEAALARPEVVSAREAVAAERARVSLLRRERLPDVTLSAGYSHEEFSDIIGGRLSVPLPIFNRNGPEIAEQEARTAQAESAARQAALRATFAVRSAFGSWQRARAAAEAISPGLEGRLRDDVAALQEAYRRGTMPLTLVLASLREAQSARRTLIEVRGDAVRASVGVHRAAGLPLCDGECR